MPKRIQRRRACGWRLPPNTVCISSPSVFGNPFTPKNMRDAWCGWMEAASQREMKIEAVRAFTQWLGLNWREAWDGPESEKKRAKLLAALPRLRGKDVACWCAECDVRHGDVILELFQ